MNYKYIFLLTAVMFLQTSTALSKEIQGFFPYFDPPECKYLNQGVYDISDCEAAKKLEEKSIEAEKLPDGKRGTFQAIGGSVLVEKRTGLRAGLYKIQVTNSPTPKTGFIIGTPKSALMFKLGSYEGCNNGNSMEILQNTVEFTFFYWECANMRLGREETRNVIYYNFDKRYQRLNSIMFTDPNIKQPILNLINGQYKFRWPDYKHSDGSVSQIYYDYKITGSRPEDLICLRSWNDDCSVSPQDPPIPPGKYKILEEDPPND